MFRSSRTFGRGGRPRALGFALSGVLAVGCLNGGGGEDGGDFEREEVEGVALPEGGPIELHGHALTTTGGLSADAHVRQASPSTNYGNSATLNSDTSDGGGQVHAYMKFSVGNVGTITRATLRLRISNTSNGNHEVRRVSSTSWSETGITWNNKPAVGSLVATIPASSSGTWRDIDITGVVAPNTTIALAVIPKTSDGLDWHSRNASNSSYRPQVVIETGSTGTGGTGGSATGGTGGSATGGTGGTIATDANLKVAFVGDTADGTNWGSVLSLALSEGAQAVVTAGDMTYDADPNGWWSRTEGVVGQSYPVFLARGNHDDTSWSGFLTEAANHLGGATRVSGPHNAAYKTIFKGLNLLTIKKGDTGTTINNLVGGDAHIWKVCSWHQNQNKMQVGGKSDEMGWEVYETCRQKGAIIVTGHEHTYHRTKTMTNTQIQTIDASCSSGSSLCVGPGRTFVTVIGTGGTGLRSQVRCTPTSSSAPYPSLNTSDASCPIWASIYTTNQGANYGAMFITFNVDGNPRKARGYFKTISGVTVDSFTIFAD